MWDIHRCLGKPSTRVITLSPAVCISPSGYEPGEGEMQTTGKTADTRITRFAPGNVYMPHTPTLPSAPLSKRASFCVPAFGTDAISGPVPEKGSLDASLHPVYIHAHT